MIHLWARISDGVQRAMLSMIQSLYKSSTQKARLFLPTLFTVIQLKYSNQMYSTGALIRIVPTSDSFSCCNQWKNNTINSFLLTKSFTLAVKKRKVDIVFACWIVLSQEVGNSTKCFNAHSLIFIRVFLCSVDIFTLMNGIAHCCMLMFDFIYITKRSTRWIHNLLQQSNSHVWLAQLYPWSSFRVKVTPRTVTLQKRLIIG